MNTNMLAGITMMNAITMEAYKARADAITLRSSIVDKTDQSTTNRHILSFMATFKIKMPWSRCLPI